MEHNSNSVGAFLDFFDTSAILIDAKDCVIKTNQKLIDENKVFNFFKFSENKGSYVPNQTDNEDWYNYLNIALTTGAAKFVLKSCIYECIMNRLLIANEQYVLICIFEYKPAKEEAADLLLNEVKSPLLKELCEKAASTAHEINNPLTVIMARIQMLQQNIKDQVPITNEVLCQNLDKIYLQTERIKKIVTGMRGLFSGAIQEGETKSEEAEIFKKSS